MSEDRAVRVFAPGAFTYDNKGDATLVFAFLSWIRAAFRDAEVTLTSFSPQADELQYGVPVLDMVVRPRSRAKVIAHRIADAVAPAAWVAPYCAYAYTALVCSVIPLWARIYRRAPTLARAIAPAHLARVAGAIEAADVVVTVPGGFLLAPRRRDHWWLFHVPTFVLADALGKPVILGPCSIGPFEELYVAMARRLLRRCERIYVREAWSEGYVLRLGVDPQRIEYCPDLAFLYHGAEHGGVSDRDESGEMKLARSWSEDGGRPVLGVSVRLHNFPGAADPVERQRVYLEAVANAADYVVEHYDARVVIVPQTLEDLPAGQLVWSQMARQDEAVAVEDDLAPSQLQELYRRFRIVIGTRMHANILAMCVDTPVVAIGYQPKTEGIMRALGLEEWVVPIEDVGGLLETTRKAWLGAEDIRSTLRGRIEEMRTEALSRASELRGRHEVAGGT
jgi:colanic acid/amylovoran biosynthesis protein